MDRAIWNGQEIIIEEVIDDYNVERSIKIASKQNELRCPDLNCNQNILEYCHGAVRIPYFRHKENSECNYAIYDKENSKHRELQHKLYNHFKSHFKILLDQNIIGDHYTPMLFILQDSKLAIELLDSHFNIERTEDLNRKYKENGLNVQWIVNSKIEFKDIEKDFAFLKRFAIRLSDNKELIVVDGFHNVKQYKWNEKENVFSSQTKTIKDLMIRNNRIQIYEFEEQYKAWRIRLNSNQNKPQNQQSRKQSQDFKDQIVIDLIDSIKRRQANNTYDKLPIYDVWSDENQWFDKFRDLIK